MLPKVGLATNTVVPEILDIASHVSTFKPYELGVSG